MKNQINKSENLNNFASSNTKPLQENEYFSNINEYADIKKDFVNNVKANIPQNVYNRDYITPGKQLKTTLKTAFEFLDYGQEVIPEIDDTNLKSIHNSNYFTETGKQRLITDISEKQKKGKVDYFAKMTKEIVTNKEWGSNSFVGGSKLKNITQLPRKRLVSIGQSIVSFPEKRKAFIYDKLKDKISKSYQSNIKTEE